MKKILTLGILGLSLSGCGGYIEVEDLPDRSNEPVTSQPAPTQQPVNVHVNVVVEGSNLNNSNSNVAEGGQGGSSTSSSQGGAGGSSSATGGSNSNNITSGNNTATGTGGSGNGGSSSAGNSTANNSSSSNSTNNSTNSGSASNQANNSTNNSSDSSSNVIDSGNSTNTNSNTNTNSAEVDLDQDFDFNIFLEGDEDYFTLVRRDRTRTPGQCVDPQAGRNFLCHAYDFTGRNSLANQLAGAPHLGSFYMDRFDVTARSWDQGFPKFPASLSHLRENYAVRCFTRLRVTEPGVHTFSITSDDGMRVLLNNSPIVQDDGLHSPRTVAATSNLVTGLYNMEVQWFQGPRTQIAAEIRWSTPSNPTLRYIEASDTQKAKRLCQ